MCSPRKGKLKNHRKVFRKRERVVLAEKPVTP
jgi:hypothetical protein